jgi:hypothetical protein
VSAYTVCVARVWIRCSQILPQGIRYGFSRGFFERRQKLKEEATKPVELVPERYRMFAEHRVVIDTEYVPTTRRRQGRSKPLMSLLPSLSSLRRDGGGGGAAVAADGAMEEDGEQGEDAESGDAGDGSGSEA